MIQRIKMKFQRKHISDYIVCLAYRASQKQREETSYQEYDTVEKILATMFPYISEKVIYAAMERACNHDLVEFGVSLRTGWLTPAGHALIEENE